MNFENVLHVLSEVYSDDCEEITKEMVAAISAGKKTASPLWLEMFGKDTVPTPKQFLEKVKERIVLQIQ